MHAKFDVSNGPKFFTYFRKIFVKFIGNTDGLHLTSRGYVGGTTQKNMLFVPLLDPAGVGGSPEIDCKPRILVTHNFTD